MFDTETNDLLSKIFFGEIGHFAFDIPTLFHDYVFQYIEYFAPLDGKFEKYVHILSLILDDLVKQPVYNIIKKLFVLLELSKFTFFVDLFGFLRTFLHIIKYH